MRKAVIRIEKGSYGAAIVVGEQLLESAGQLLGQSSTFRTKGTVIGVTGKVMRGVQRSYGAVVGYWS